MRVRNLVLCCCVLLVFKDTQAKPFLRNTFQTLASSLISPSSSSGNIEDLRQRKPEKIRGLSKYQDDQEEPLEDEGGDANSQNEAIPNIFQKKVNAIVRKLQIIAEIGRQFIPTNGKDNGNEGEPKDSDFEFDFDEDFDAKDNSTEPSASILNIEIPEEEQKTSGKSKFFAPGDLGVYVMEFVGSIVGLIYGAAIQFANPRTNQ